MRMPRRFDAVVVKIGFEGRPPQGLRRRIVALIDAWSADGSVVTAHVSGSPAELYIYRIFPSPLALSHEDMRLAQASAARWLRVPGARVQASRLQCVFDVAGRSHGEHAPDHYIVETDARRGWMPELGRWYDIEHMPALAAVPGCVRARRYLNWDHGPRSLACYDLVAASTLATPEWLAVRATDWSGRVRPNFRNTKRTMFETVRR